MVSWVTLFNRGLSWVFHHPLTGASIVGFVLLIGAWSTSDKFIDLWLTPDQQGYFHFRQSDYANASLHFENSSWRATSHYIHGEFDKAATLFALVPNDSAQFNYANALAHNGQYSEASMIYQLLRSSISHGAGANINLAIIKPLAEESISQSYSLRGEIYQDDNIHPSQKNRTEKRARNSSPEQQYSAYAILRDPALNELWMQQIRKDPAQFLKVKFQLQNRDPSRFAPTTNEVSDEQ
ncbi:hypothetical protein L4D20_04655 [Vibrio kyushuensis]|uniref:tetratricopeptide repeat protein n=1 Tax=Vibrio kyushuensis TaxID=2910249 RepID=UPI003D0B9671